MRISHLDADHYVIHRSAADRSWDDTYVGDERAASLDERFTLLFDNDDDD